MMKRAAQTVAGMTMLLHLGPHDAFGQNITACKSVKDNAKRLACYDRAAGSDTSQQPVTASKPAQRDPAQLPLSRVQVATRCNPRTLYEALFARVPKKSEFETAEAYGLRVTALIPAESRTNLFCGIGSDNPPTYDAEKRRFVAYLSEPYVSDEKVTGTFRGQNAYGASVTVEQRAEERWEVSYGHYFSTVDVEADPERARQAAPTLRIGVIGDLVSPFVEEDRRTSTATIHLPYETTSTIHKVIMRPRYFLGYDKADGNVLWSVPVRACYDRFSGKEKLQIEPCSAM